MTGEELHEIMCDDTRPCARWWVSDSRHRFYYVDQAATLTAQLEPLIGEANIGPVVRAVVAALF